MRCRAAGIGDLPPFLGAHRGKRWKYRYRLSVHAASKTPPTAQIKTVLGGRGTIPRTGLRL
jgi:hypothetical protein